MLQRGSLVLLHGVVFKDRSAVIQRSLVLEPVALIYEVRRRHSPSTLDNRYFCSQEVKMCDLS